MPTRDPHPVLAPQPPHALRRRDWLAALPSLAMLGWGTTAASALAQSGFPAKPIKLVCPYGAGGPVDVVGRYMAACLQRGFADAAPVVVENLAGAGGITGTQHVLRTPGDGYTLLAQVTAALLTTQLSSRQAGYDAQQDFVPVWGLTSLGTVILVGAKSQYTSVKALVDAARAQPGKLTYGSAGVGTTPHINTEMFANATGIKMTHVPYKSSAAAINDLLGGHIDCFLASIASSVGLINEGRIRGLAVLRPDRIAEIGQVPTIKESGVTDWMPPPAIFALYATSTVPAALREQIAAATQKGFEADTGSAAKLKQLGLSGAIRGKALLDTAQEEAALLRKTIAEAGIALGG